MTARSAALALAILTVMGGGCRSGSTDPATVQENFGVRMAKMNLWREAMFRFQRAVEMNPEDAMAHNNLAVALEANGDFERDPRTWYPDRGEQSVDPNGATR